MRSDISFNLPLVSGRRSGTRRLGCLGVLLPLLVLCLAPARPQYDFSDEPLLASAISDLDIDLRGRYVRQWRTDDGTFVLLFNGGFRLHMGQREMSATDAVVWVEPRRAEKTDRRYYTVAVYLSENARVREAGGTITEDTALLVRGLRTYGDIIKYHDAHASEDLSQSPLYQQALHDRLLIEQGGAVAPEPPPGMPATAPEVPEVDRPTTVRPRSAKHTPRMVSYRLPQVEPARTEAGDQVFVATGGVYFSQAGGPDAPMLEIRADSAVVFASSEGAASLFASGPEAEEEVPATQPAEVAPRPDRPLPPPPPEDGAEPAAAPEPAEDTSSNLLVPSQAGQQLRAVYLEGDVILSMGSRFVRASRLYYDFEYDRALILDAVFRADVPDRDIPLYVRAAEIRQLSAREFSAQKAIVTTSEFFTPHYHVGADKVVLRDLTVRDNAGRASGPLAGTYELTGTTLNVGGLPLLYWPYSEGRLETSETLLRRLRTGYSSDRGAELETSWHLFNLLGATPPEGYDASLHLDYFSKRGPALGIDVDYEREDHYGLFRSYYIHDEGEDTLGPLRRHEEEPTTTERGRVLWRHRHYLPHDWEATLEVAYISDPNFLEEYRRDEFHEGKDQETLAYLKRARGVEAITFLINWRTLDFVTQTEHLPEFTYRRSGDTFLSPLVLYHESRIGAVRRQRDQRYFVDHPLFSNQGSTDVTTRGDARQEIELPLKIGTFNLVPFASVRGTLWDGQPLDRGRLWRGLGVYGLRGGTSLSRVYDGIQSDLLDINRIRHIVQPQFAAWWAHSNARSELIYPFDYGIETIDSFYGVTGRLHQIWQTKRGLADQPRTVDLLTLNLEFGLFGNVEGRFDESNGYANPLRPENSRPRNYFAGDLIYRLSDSTSLLYDFNIDLNDWAYDRQNVALAVERSPRLAYVFGWRHAGDIDLSLIGGGWNYRLNEKHTTAARAWMDIERGDLGEVTLAYIRKLPRWHLGLTFEYDNIDDDFTISVSLWPEGIPEWTIGSGRFNQLGTTTGIRP